VGNPVQGKEVVLLRKDLMEGVVIKPGRAESAVGSAFVSIGQSRRVAYHQAASGGRFLLGSC
jgi:hypothetical protein